MEGSEKLITSPTPWGTGVSPSAMPRSVTTSIPINIAPLTPRAIIAPVKSKPNSDNSVVGFITCPSVTYVA